MLQSSGYKSKPMSSVLPVTCNVVMILVSLSLIKINLLQNMYHPQPYKHYNDPHAPETTVNFCELQILFSAYTCV